jgi:hypothetical protein
LDGQWFEVRATVGGLLDLPDLVSITPFSTGGAGLLNLVTNESARNPRTRRLPTLYLGSQPVYADRSLDALVDHLRKLLAAFRSSSEKSMYLMKACRLDGRIGVYAGEVYNRSNYIRKLGKRGIEFDGEGYLELTPRNTFRSEDYGEFRPSFMIVAMAASDQQTVALESKAMAAMTAARYRMGPMPPHEVAPLLRTISGAQLVSASTPRDVIDHLRRVLN